MDNEYINEPEIKISNLLYRILRRWRLLLIWMIIGIAALDVYAYYRTKKKADSIKQSITDYQEKLSSGAYDTNGNEIMSLPDFEKNLSKRQISEVNNLVSTYKMFQTPYSNTVDYINNSILMQLDPKEIPTYSLQYFVNTHYTVEYPEINKKDYTSDILNSITPALLNDDTLNEIAKGISSDENKINSAYIGELITTEAEDSTYSITVFGRSEEECTIIAEKLKERINAVLKSLQSKYGDFDYSLINEEYSISCNMGVLDAQQQRADKLNTTYNSTRGMINNLTDDQKLYFYAILNNENTITLELPVESDGESDVFVDPSAIDIPVPSFINIKYMVAGAIIGLAFICAYIIVFSIFGNRLLTNDDIEDIYSLHQIGIWRLSPSPKGLFKFIDKWLINILDSKGEQFNSEESLEMIAAGIRLSSQKNNWDKIFITSSANSEISKEAISKITEQLKKSIKTVTSGKSIVYDPESLENLCSSDACVLVEQIDVSKMDEIKTEYNLCDSYSIPIIGYVTIK